MQQPSAKTQSRPRYQQSKLVARQLWPLIMRSWQPALQPLLSTKLRSRLRCRRMAVAEVGAEGVKEMTSNGKMTGAEETVGAMETTGALDMTCVEMPPDVVETIAMGETTGGAEIDMTTETDMGEIDGLVVIEMTEVEEATGAEMMTGVEETKSVQATGMHKTSLQTTAGRCFERV